jgi:hypothetical protein
MAPEGCTACQISTAWLCQIAAVWAFRLDGPGLSCGPQLLRCGSRLILLIGSTTLLPAVADGVAGLAAVGTARNQPVLPLDGLILPLDHGLLFAVPNLVLPVGLRPVLPFVLQSQFQLFQLFAHLVVLLRCGPPFLDKWSHPVER